MQDLRGQRGLRSAARLGTLGFVPRDGHGPVQSEVLALISGSELRGRLANGPAAFKLEAVKTLTAIIYPGETGRWLVAFNPETGTTTQGKTVEQALQNLKEAVTRYLEERPAAVRPGAILATFELEHG